MPAPPPARLDNAVAAEHDCFSFLSSDAHIHARHLVVLQETHVRLRDEIDRGHEPSPYSHTVQDARAKSTLVGLQASLMAAHLSSMLQRMDENAPS